MSGRTPFTSKDEDYLAQYIAKYNPKLSGRKGNALYLQLVENAGGKWPFAKRHSWQSWRNHYIANSTRMDNLISKHLRRTGQPVPTTPLRSQLATPRQATNAPASQSKRVPFTRDDDRKIIDFIANVSPSAGSRKGQKLWMALAEDPAKYSWAAKRGWQSWRERYVNNAKYFDHAVKKRLNGDDGEGSEDDEDGINPPRTVEDYRVRKRPSQAGLSANAEGLSPEKRKRISDAAGNAPPKKKKRVQALSHDEDEQPEAGPSRHRDDEPAQDDGAAAHDEDEGQPDAFDDDEVEQDVDQGRESDEDEDDEVDEGPIVSEDYRGEIFESPGQPEDAGDVPDSRASSDTSGHDREELFHMLTHDARGKAHDDDDMEVDENVDPTMVETSGNTQDDAEDQSRAVGASASGEYGIAPTPSSPPARRHHPRIERELPGGLGTPPLSPTDEAQARHRLEHDHSPAPTRKRVPRIRRPAEEFFGTPQTTSNSGTAVSSPTSHHLAHARKAARTDDEDEGGDVVKPRAPPRLVEGAWTKAFSDVRGKSRISNNGRRKSGVDFEDEEQIIGVQDTPASPSDQGDEGEDMPATPTRWPPLRRKDTPIAPSTPVASKNKGKARADASVDSTVRTEKVVSVKTVRTVERRIPRASNGTPYVRGALAARVQDEDTEDEADGEPEPSQHHPFSQPAFAPRMAASTSNQSAASNPPVPRADVARLQRLLSGQLREAPQPSPSKADRDARPLVHAPRPSRFYTGAGVSRTRAVPSRETISPPGVVHDDNGERFEKFEEHDEELPGPVSEEAVPRAFSSPPLPLHAALRVDKGKGKAPGASHMMGHARRHTLAGPDARDALPGPSHHNPVADRHSRRSVPSEFTIGDELPRSALSLLFHPPRSDSYRARSHSLAQPSGMSSSRSISPHVSADVAAAKQLPSNELDLVLEIGLGQVFRIMAENHGFSEPTVRDAFAATGSLEQTDRLLGKMRESANKAANEVLQTLDGDDGDNADGNGQDDPDDDEPDHDGGEGALDDEDKDNLDEGHHNYGRSARNDEEEVEDVLAHDSWMKAGAPLAESSRFDASHSNRGSSFGPDARRRRSLVIRRISPEPPSPADYSPPKRTRAGKHIARQSLSKASHAMDVDPAANDGSPDVGHARPSAVGFGELARYSNDQWRRMGASGAKMMTGKALAKLLQ